ncbi:MAG: carboxypeptidase M32 [Gammaproteobacteria bacterium]|nr:carboxypeptidase M32 [Gammaproteobacteria bacterium]
MSHAKFETFKARLGEISDINSAISLLHWDQEVYMPPKAAAGRGQQLATLSGLSHRLFTRPEIGALILDLQNEGGLTGDDAKLLSETAHDYNHAMKLPEAFVQKLAIAQSQAYEAWTQARKDSDFSQFQPHLQAMLDLMLEKAEYLGYQGSPYNALLDEYERGMTAAYLSALFTDLAPRQQAFVERLVNAPGQPDLGWLKQPWNPDTQWDFSIEILKEMGYDFGAGRQDKSVHPFSINFDTTDVRVTTRIDPNDLFSGLMGSMHEGGHALYEQGFLERDRRTVLGQAISLGIHESQSLLWENIIGRSLPFWRRHTAALQAAYPGQLDGKTPEDIYRAVNHVTPSFIRVEADECTYNLHVILRFEIELALVEGDLKVAEVPEAWNAKMKQYLGLDVPNDALGCLQDIHWSHGSMGYFPTYALGNLYSAQLFEAVEKALPDLWNQVEKGDFAPLLGWLRKNVHEVGRRKTAPELIQHVTGQPPCADPFMRYLEKKYLPLYGLA